jgi:hypothetical protein
VDNFYVFGAEQFLSAALGADAYKMKCLGLGTRPWDCLNMLKTSTNDEWIVNILETCWETVGKMLGTCWVITVCLG